MFDQTHIILILKEILRYEPNKYKRKAYEHAIKILKNHTENIATTDFTLIDGIGDKLNSKIHEIHNTGTCQTLLEFQKTGNKLVSDEEFLSLEELQQLDGIGIVKAKALYVEGYRSLTDIETAVKAGKLPDVWLPKLQAVRSRVPYNIAKNIADKIITEILNSGYSKRYMVCGSLRRKKETIKDIDVVLECDTPDEISHIQALAKNLGVIIQSGNQSVRFSTSDINIDLRLTPSKFFGYMVNYYTGSAEFNIKLRAEAKRKGWLINERGVFIVDSTIRVALLNGMIVYIDENKFSPDKKVWVDITNETFQNGKDEIDLFDIMNVKWVDPENR